MTDGVKTDDSVNREPFVFDFDDTGIQEWRLLGSAEGAKVIIKRAAAETPFGNSKFEVSDMKISNHRVGLQLAIAGQTVIGQFTLEELPENRCQIRLRSEDIGLTFSEANRCFFAAALDTLYRTGFFLGQGEDFSPVERNDIIDVLYGIEAQLIAQGELSVEHTATVQAGFALLREASLKQRKSGWQRAAGLILEPILKGVMGLAAQHLLTQALDVMGPLSDRLLPPGGSGSGTGGGGSF